MLINTSKGLYCPAGNFHIDPLGGVENAVITHAHSDHARRGSKIYYCVNSGVGLLKARLGKNISVSAQAFRKNFYFGDVKVSFYPAGHILGSCQVRIEYAGEVWVVSGDYKRDFDPTCEAFESVECDVFVTEATFGTPSFRWNKKADLGREIFDWYEKNKAREINSVLFAYSLGKTQRILGLLDPFMSKPVYCHPASRELIDCYRNEGIELAQTIYLDEIDKNLVGELILAPQSALEKYGSVIGNKIETAFASGWTARGGHSYGKKFDRGFTLSDHADWDDLIATVEQTKAKRVYVQHRGEGALVRHLKSLGINAFSTDKLSDSLIDKVKGKDLGQLPLF